MAILLTQYLQELIQLLLEMVEMLLQEMVIMVVGLSLMGLE